MRLVTLEGLPKTCIDVLNTIHKQKMIVVLPSPMIPLATSAQITPADDVCKALSNSLSRLKMLHRMNLASSSIICGGCHWIESPPLGVPGRAILHRLIQDLSRAISDELGVDIEKHIIIVLNTSVHECFENLLRSMEGRDYTLHDLYEEKTFLERVSSIPGALSAFPHAVYHVSCPPFMLDNDIDLVKTSIKITDILKSHS